MKTLIFTLLMLGAPITSLHAQDFRIPPGKWWEIPQVVEALQLSSEQQQQISNLVYEHARRMIGLNGSVEESKLVLSREVDAKAFDPEKVRTAFGLFQDSRRKLENERFEMLLAVRQLLSADQWKKLGELHRLKERRQREGMGNFRRPPRPGGANRPQKPRGPRP